LTAGNKPCALLEVAAAGVEGEGYEQQALEEKASEAAVASQLVDYNHSLVCGI